MEIQNQFKRYEIKYLLDSRRYSAVRRAMEGRTVGDEYGRSTVCNVYYDTPDHRIILRSLEKPPYKEKMRLRSYGTPRGDSKVFLELKKKYTIIMVTHNMQQAARVSDKTAFFLLGEAVEFDDTQKIFSKPKDKRTEDYITGRFG